MVFRERSAFGRFWALQRFPILGLLVQFRSPTPSSAAIVIHARPINTNQYFLRGWHYRGRILPLLVLPSFQFVHFLLLHFLFVVSPCLGSSTFPMRRTCCCMFQWWRLPAIHLTQGGEGGGGGGLDSVPP